MKTRGQWLIDCAVLLAGCAAVGIRSTACAAQTDNPQWVLSAPQEAVFSRVESAMTYAARRAGVALVLEGEPYKKVLTPSEAQSINPHAAPRQMLEQVASAYDYAVEPQKDGSVTVLKKRYTNPDDLPFVTLAETSAVLSDMSRLLARFNLRNADPNHTSPGPFLREFAASLSPEQQSALMNLKQGLPVRQLSPYQRDRLWRVPLYVYIQTSDSKIGAIRRHVDLVSSDPLATIGREGTDKYRNKPLFGYAVFLPERKPPRYFRPLNVPNLSLESDTTTRFSVTDVNAEDQTEPIALSPGSVEEIRSAAALSFALSLREAVRQTRLRAPEDIAPVVVANEIADKPVALINASAAPPQSLLRALAETCGLRLVKEADGVYSLSRSRLPETKTIADLPQALQQLLPAPFGRALHLQEIKDLDEQIGTLQGRLNAYRQARSRTVPAAPPVKKESGDAARPVPSAMDKEGAALETELAQVKDRQQRLANRPEALRWATVRYLRTVIEPRLKSEGKPLVPIASLGNTEKAALAAFFLTDLWKSVSERIGKPAPGYITHFEDGIIIGNEKTIMSSEKAQGAEGSQVQHGFTVSFYYHAPDGKLVQGGLMYTAYTPPTQGK